MSNQYFTTLEDSSKQFSMLNTSNSNIADNLTTRNTIVTNTTTLNVPLVFSNTTVLTAAELLNAAEYTLKTSDSGKLFVFSDQQTGACTINLPTPVGNAGVNFSFASRILDPVNGQTLTISSNAANLVGVIIDLDANTTPGVIAFSAKKQNIIIGAGANAGGLQLHIYSDGTLYHIKGTVTFTSGGDPITFN